VRVLDDPPVDWSPIWSADGRSLLFASTRGGTMNLWRIAVDPATGHPGGEPSSMTVPSSWVGFLSASADGRRVAYLDRNVRNTIHRAPFDPAAGTIAGPPRSVPLGTIEPYETVDLSPDGADLVFDDAGFPQRLFLVDAKGLLRQLTDGPHRDRQGAFSPDGAWIAFQTDRWPGKLAMIRPDGSGLRELAASRTASAFYPVWSPDGRRLAFSSTGGAFSLAVENGKAAGEPVPIVPPDEAGVAFWPSSFSPDGRQLAGTLHSTANVVRGAAIYSIPDRTYRKLPADDPALVLFLPDGRRLLVAASRGLGVIDLANGRLRPLAPATEGSEIVWAALSRDGRHLAWHERADESDIWLAELGEKR
jgi:WD40 repeat protein